jgi:hypothetical protein
VRLARHAHGSLLDVVIGFVLAVLLLVAVPTDAFAHNATYWFDPLRWDSVNVDYKIDDSIPGANGSDFENRIHDAVGRWNSQCCIGFFVYDDVGNGQQTWADGACSWSTDPTDLWAFYNNLPEGLTGSLQRCEVVDQQQQVTTIRSARLTFDTLVGTGLSWHTADSEPGTNELWVEETGLHELGHGTGTFRGGNPSEGSDGGHWPADSVMCSANGDEADWTMCRFADPGHSYRVPLEPHDIDTFQDWY